MREPKPVQPPAEYTARSMQPKRLPTMDEQERHATPYTKRERVGERERWKV